LTYRASENFSVTYKINDMVRMVQEKISAMKHACADTVVKDGVRNFLDLSFMVVRKQATDTGILKTRIQTAVSNYVAKFKMGDGFNQSELISVVRAVEGVSDIRLPITRMTKRNGSFIPLDHIGSPAFEIYHKSSGVGITSYRSVSSVLSYSTSENGGDPNLFRGVYENNVSLMMMSSASDVSKGPGRAYIQGDGKIIVTTTDGNPPQSKDYKAAYYTYYPAGVNPVDDIMTSEIEYLDVDSLTFKDIEIIDEKSNKRGL